MRRDHLELPLPRLWQLAAGGELASWKDVVNDQRRVSPFDLWIRSIKFRFTDSCNSRVRAMTHLSTLWTTGKFVIGREWIAVVCGLTKIEIEDFYEQRAPNDLALLFLAACAFWSFPTSFLGRRRFVNTDDGDSSRKSRWRIDRHPHVFPRGDGRQKDVWENYPATLWPKWAINRYYGMGNNLPERISSCHFCMIWSSKPRFLRIVS